jgi:hypothetical protein
MPTADLSTVFARLKQIMQPFAGRGLRPQPDTAQDFTLIGPPVARSKGREIWFGAVQIKKNYVSFHLMPVYAFPDLLADISPALRKRMQGKSCFNFTRIDEGLFAELEQLAQAGYARFLSEKLILSSPGQG